MRKKSIPVLLVVVFFVSGLSSLIYQTAWQRILTLYYSVENISTTLIVSVYMMGLGLGAILGGFITERIKRRLRFYFFIELAIGLFGIISIPFLELIGMKTTGSNYLVSFIGMFLFLCIPTVLMGITLPLLTKIYQAHVKSFFNTLSYLYFINTLGAAVGCLVTSYFLITFFGLDSSVYFAAFLNFGIALSVWFYKAIPDSNKTQQEDSNDRMPDPETAFNDTRLVFLLVFVTGFIAVGYEIIWFRVIGTIVKASPYAFSSILFMYLTGIALGSYLMKYFLKRRPGTNRRNLFFLLQFSIALYVVVSVTAYYLLIRHVPVFSSFTQAAFANMEHPYAGLPRTATWMQFFKDLFKIFDVFLWPFAFVFIPTLCMGASFPLIASLAYKNKHAGSIVGNVYFFNVLGNVTGGLLTGLVLLEILGSEQTLLMLSIIGLLFSLFMSGKRMFKLRYKLIALGILLPFVILIFPGKHDLYRAIHPAKIFDVSEQKIFTEGIDGIIATYSFKDSLRTYINGMSHGGRPIPIFSYEAVKTLSYVRNPESVLVIGFGTGSTIETILKHPYAHITLVELSRTLIKNLRNIDYLKSDLDNPRLHLTYADGRRYLHKTDTKFDAVFMDPLRTTTSYSNNLYSREFFELVKKHMKPGAAFMVWTDEHNIIPRTLSSVFPFVKQYSFFCTASITELTTDTDFEQLMYTKFSDEFRRAMQNIDSNEKQPLQRRDILARTAGFPINKDYKPFTEYYLGLKRY